MEWGVCHEVVCSFRAGWGIDDERLCEAVNRAESGSIDARLGGELIKQRVSRAGGGRSGGFRTLIAYQTNRRSVFLYGFAKNERDNIGPKKLAELKVLAKTYMALSETGAWPAPLTRRDHGD